MKFGKGTISVTIRFAVIGINHNHIFGQVNALLGAGATFAGFFAPEDDLAADFAARYPQARRFDSSARILDDPNIALVASAGVNADRAALGIEVMRAGKDFMSDKPGMTTLDQLADVRRVQADTKRIYSILYSERLENAATIRAAELARAGAIGKVIQTIGLGPHRVHPPERPAWFWDPSKFGGIICDIGSHQFDQFLYFTGSTRGEIVAAQVRNIRHADRPGFQDFGDVMVNGDGGTGYIRVDWFTPDGLPTWGDGRLTVLGTDGYIEARKYVDLAGRDGGSHLFLVDAKGVRHIDCNDVALPYGSQLVDDVLQRTETAMSQGHCFHAMELALRAQKQARALT